MAQLHLEYINERKEEVLYLDYELGRYIDDAEGENCDYLIRNDPRQTVHYQLSMSRFSTVRWYPFQANASILEVEGGFGAITGALCDKVKHVVVTESSLFRAQAIAKRYAMRENLDVFAGDVRNMKFAEKYDYIILDGVLERVGAGIPDNTVYTDYIRALLSYLKPQGKVLIVMENRYGIRNWGGRKETYTHIPLEGIAGYPEGTDARTFHKKQIQDILNYAGLTQCRFYYPLPDHYMVRAVYSDERLPGVDALGLFTESGESENSLLFDEMNVLKDVVENGMFAFFANSFFVEASRTDEHSNIKSVEVLGWEEYDAHPLETERRKRQAARNRSLLAQKGNIVLGEADKDKTLIERVHKVQLELLGELLRVCEENGLKLYLIYGSLLGAVRHGGVIPWDDDIDVALSRADYNKLLNLEDNFSEPYFLQTPWNDNCFFGGYLKLRNKNTTSVHPQNWWVTCCEGIGIDIFPLDTGYKNFIFEKKKELTICFYQRLLYAKTYGYFSSFMDMHLLLWKAYKYLGKIFTRKQLADRLDHVMAAGDNDDSAPFGIFAHYTKGKKYRKLSRKAFENCVKLRYEDMLLWAPAGYHQLLLKQYGDLYMNFPVKEAGKRRHGFYAVNVPYLDYKKRFSGLFRPLPDGKDIVLFGDNTMLDAYFKRYGKKYMPKHIVITDSKSFSEKIHGIFPKQFDQFRPPDRDRLYPVICSLYVRKVERMMREAGYRDYYIFISNRDWLLLEDPAYALQEIERL